MAKNKQIDLQNILFGQLERLNDDELMMENGEMEIERSKAISSLGKTVIMNAKLALDVLEYQDQIGLENKDLPPLLSHE